MNEDWEQVSPFLQDMQQHCGEEDFFNPQEVCKNILFFYTKNKYFPTNRDIQICVYIVRRHTTNQVNKFP